VRYGEGGTLAPYNEALVGIPCVWNGRPYGYCPYICVDSDEALVSGRELLGFPKKLATFDLDISETRFIGAMKRHGVQVLRVEFEQENILFRLPLPAKERVVLPAPYDQIYALPAPTGEPQGLTLEALTTRFIADAIRPQHIASLWKQETGTFWSGRGRVEYAPSDADPLAKLPVSQVIASARFRGDTALYGDQVRVLADMA
jgi:acetoacetate decarboxylase